MKFRHLMFLCILKINLPVSKSHIAYASCPHTFDGPSHQTQKIPAVCQSHGPSRNGIFWPSPRTQTSRRMIPAVVRHLRPKFCVKIGNH